MAKESMYKEVTDRVIQALQAGPGAWVKPWKVMGLNGLPYNGVSKKPYKGINTMLLAMAGYSDPRWYTYKQAEAKGCAVRKGSKATRIVFWTFIQKEEDGKIKKIPFLRVYCVFNAEQIDGLAPLETIPADPLAGREELKSIVTDLGVKIQFGGDKASYNTSDDLVKMPSPDRFDDMDAFQGILLHEVAHWTGAATRLNRDLKGRFGSQQYAMEELVAELTSAFVSARLGLPFQMRHANYIGEWIQVLQNDVYAVFAASREAQKAADFIINRGAVVTPADEDEAQEAA